MAKNPFLKVLVMEGFYDLATPYRRRRITRSTTSILARSSEDISFATYEAGHMVYVDSARTRR